MAIKILIIGLSGSGKTTLANSLLYLLANAQYLNADIVRSQFNDWDFSIAGRLRQANRMAFLSENNNNKYIIYDFICPLDSFRDIIQPDLIIWMNTTKSSIYKDTDAIFAPLNINTKYKNIIITNFDYDITSIYNSIINYE